MALDANTQKSIKTYIEAHLADETWHINFFDFINDQELSKRLGEEFISTRYIYKMLEGLEADGWMLRSQIRIQVLSYASIYEAAIHHLLFSECSSEPKVKALTEYSTKKAFSIPSSSLTALQKHLSHDGKAIIPTYETIAKTDETKVRFDRKAECAVELGMIDDILKNELIEFYEARNAIHIHAEIRKNLQYQLDLSKRAYRRLQIFREQIVAWRATKNINRVPAAPAHVTS